MKKVKKARSAKLYTHPASHRLYKRHIFLNFAKTAYYETENYTYRCYTCALADNFAGVQDKYRKLG